MENYPRRNTLNTLTYFAFCPWTAYVSLCHIYIWYSVYDVRYKLLSVITFWHINLNWLFYAIFKIELHFNNYFITTESAYVERSGNVSTTSVQQCCWALQHHHIWCSSFEAILFNTLPHITNVRELHVYTETIFLNTLNYLRYQTIGNSRSIT